MHVLASGCPPVGAEPVWTPSGSSTMTESSVFTSSFKSSTWVCNSLILALVSLFFSVAVLMCIPSEEVAFFSTKSISATLNVCRGENGKIAIFFLEPPARIELATSSLPMRCYTTKPRWRCPCHQPFRYNRFASHPIFANSCIIWRRERDLNSRGTGPRDFQSRALPGYAISARNLSQSTSPFNALACQWCNATDSKVKGIGLSRCDKLSDHRRRQWPCMDSRRCIRHARCTTIDSNSQRRGTQKHIRRCGRST